MRHQLDRAPANFKGKAKALDQIDIPHIAATIDVGEDELRALIEVESRGHGFDKAGRPIILFEPHIFYKLLGAGAKRDRAVREGLAYPSWGQQRYPSDSYPRLLAAIDIDRDAALRSASWGLPQIMGSNYASAGFDSVEAMVAAFCDDEEHHVEALVAFLKSNGVDDDLREHRWQSLARGYNGPGYAKNAYHTRLARAFAKWQQKPDIDIREAAASESAHADRIADAHREATHGATFVGAAKIKAVQERLSELGYRGVGKADGVSGPLTTGAIAAFQRENGLPVDGKITDELIADLEAAHPREVSPERAEGEPEESRIVTSGRQLFKIGAGFSLTGAMAQGSTALDTIEQGKDMLSRIKVVINPIKGLVIEYWPLILLAGGIWIMVKGSAVVRARIDDYRSGKTQ